MKYNFKPDPPLNGKALQTKLREKIVHEPIVDSFLHKHSTVMVSSSPGVGKSVIAVQEMLQMASGQPVFNGLNVPKPVKVWFMQMERSETESLERIQFMTKTIPLAAENIFLDTQLQSMNFLNPKDFEYIVERGLQIKPDVLYVDPLYGLASGLSKDDVGSELSKRFTILKQVLNCAVRINHHNVKDTYNQKGELIVKDDPFYGAIWLKAHVTGSYLLTKTSEGCCLVNKKDSHTNMLKKIDLSFDNDTFISSMDIEDLDYHSKYKLWCNSKYADGNRGWKFNEAQSFLGCTTQRLRQLNLDTPFKDILKKLKISGKATLYTIERPI